jgi:hypothetical protein
MEKRKAKLLAFLLLGLLTISLATQLVSAQETLTDIIGDPIVDLVDFIGPGGALETGKISINLTKYLFIFLVILIIWSILDAIEIIRKDSIKWFVSIIIGFLAVAYLTPEEIWGLLTSYQALGVTLLFVIPFVVLGFFTIQSVRKRKVTGVVLQRYLWLVFAIYISWRLIDATFIKKLLSVAGGATTVVIIIAATVASWLLFLFNKKIVRLIAADIDEGLIGEMERKQKLAAAKVKSDAESAESIAGG